MVVVALLVAGVDVMAGEAVVDRAIPSLVASNQKPCRRCPPCPAATSRRTFRCRVAEARGAIIEARRPLLVFSRVSLTMIRPSSSSSLSALAAKTGAGGKKRPLPPMAPPPPTGGRDTPEIKEFRRRRPDCNVYVNRAARDVSTDALGQHRNEIPVDNDDDDYGGNNDDGGGATEIPGGVGDEFEAPLKGGKAEFGSLGVAASPPVGIGIGRGWGDLERQ
jgi:hypothetical protein